MRRVTLALGLLALAGAPAWAGPPTDQVRTYTEQVLKIVEDPGLSLADKRAAVRRVAQQVFDTHESARRALGRHWHARTPAEREEFTQLFADLLERTYISKIDLYGGERLEYTGETVDGGFALVRAKVVSKQGVEVPVEARLLFRDGRWLIYDVTIEHVSLIANYRAQFDRIIRTASYAELVKRLKTRLDELLDDRGPGSGRRSRLEDAGAASI